MDETASKVLLADTLLSLLGSRAIEVALQAKADDRISTGVPAGESDTIREDQAEAFDVPEQAVQITTPRVASF